MRLTDFKVLTFDVYGTLIDWETGILTALEPLLARLDTRLNDNDVLQAHAYYESTTQKLTPGQSYKNILATVYLRLAESWKVQVDWAECMTYGESVGNWPAFADSAESLAYLRQHYQLGVLSNVFHESFAGSNIKLGRPFHYLFTAQDAGSYKPDLRNFDYMLAHLARQGVEKHEILHVAESLFHDHQPANAKGLANCWIYRRHDKEGYGATRDPDEMPSFDFRFTSMAQFVQAHKTS